ncbi:MAG: Flp family type IVb pilin [Pseudomonadota bacterium]
MFKKFLQDERGATAVEYGLIVTVLSLAIVVGVSTVGTTLQDEWTDINSRTNQAIQ